MPAAVKSVFDIACWFSDRALDEGEYLQPMKLQALIYLSQSYFAAVHNRKKLIPAVFVAEEGGPVEPSLHCAWIPGSTNVIGDGDLGNDTKVFVDSIWRRFGHHSAEYLAKLCCGMRAFKEAKARGKRSEILLEDMVADLSRENNAPEVEQVIKPKILRSHKGRAVTVEAWDPRVLKRKSKGKDEL